METKDISISAGIGVKIPKVVDWSQVSNQLSQLESAAQLETVTARV